MCSRTNIHNFNYSVELATFQSRFISLIYKFTRIVFFPGSVKNISESVQIRMCDSFRKKFSTGTTKPPNEMCISMEELSKSFKQFVATKYLTDLIIYQLYLQWDVKRHYSKRVVIYHRKMVPKKHHCPQKEKLTIEKEKSALLYWSFPF